MSYNRELLLQSVSVANVLSPVDDDDFAVIMVGLCVALKNKTKKRIWKRKWLERRSTHGHRNLLSVLTQEPSDYRNFLRMNQSVFNKLLEIISPLIRKKDTTMRAAISPAERLILTLRFLATGNSFEDLKFSSYIAANTIGIIVMETCEALCVGLKKYIMLPENPTEWKRIAQQFSEKWNFPHCIGALDGKHIDIIKPSKSGSFYYNYKGRFSVVLLAVVNANYEFLMADCGINGRVSDGGVLGYTRFGEKLSEGSLGLPADEKLSNFDDEKMPYVFVGDDAFPLSCHLMKPYKGSNLPVEQRVFNYRCSRARRISENVFGILGARFRIFQKPIQLAPKKVQKIVMACCYLHNYLQKNQKGDYMPADSVDFEIRDTGETILGSWRKESSKLLSLQASESKNSSTQSKSTRDKFTDYFNGVGAVTWQDKMLSIN